MNAELLLHKSYTITLRGILQTYVIRIFSNNTCTLRRVGQDYEMGWTMHGDVVTVLQAYEIRWNGLSSEESFLKEDDRIIRKEVTRLTETALSELFVQEYEWNLI